MQEKSDTFRDFLIRTDRLAYQKGSKTEDLAGLLDVSRASLFGYRSGKRAIPSKVWMRLADLEEEAGMTEGKVAETSVPYSAETTESRIARLERAVASSHEAITNLTLLIERQIKEMKP